MGGTGSYLIFDRDPVAQCRNCVCRPTERQKDGEHLMTVCPTSSLSLTCLLPVLAKLAQGRSKSFFAEPDLNIVVNGQSGDKFWCGEKVYILSNRIWLA